MNQDGIHWEKIMDDFLKKRNDALSKLDMDWARNQMPGINDHTRLIAMHKARYECVQLDASLRHVSRSWLEDHGHKRMYGMAWPPGTELPE